MFDFRLSSIIQIGDVLYDIKAENMRVMRFTGLVDQGQLKSAKLASLNKCRIDHSLVSFNENLNRSIIATGGYEASNSHSSVYRYRIDGNKWD